MSTFQFHQQMRLFGDVKVVKNQFWVNKMYLGQLIK